MPARAVEVPDGTTIAYDVVGAGPPCVFIHGLTSSRGSWDPITDDLAGELTCVRIDLRGHGESSAARDYALPALVADVRAVVDELALEEPVVIGNSLGANVVAVYAAAFPVRAAVVIDQVLRWGDFARLVAPLASRLRGPDCMQAVLDIDRLLGVDFAPGDAFERRVLSFPPEVIRGLWDAVLTIPADELTALAETLLANITAPLLSLHGSAPPRDYPAWLTGLIPSAEIEVWEDAGHLLHLTERERFVARLRTLLRSV